MKKTLIIHSCWALAVIVAFSLGWRSGIPAPGDAANFNGHSDVSRTSSGISESGSEVRSSRRIGSREISPRGRGRLEGLFGKIASGSGSLDALITQALKDPNPITRRLAFSRVLEALTPENAEAIRLQLVTLGADESQWRDFHYSWGALAGKAAFDYAAKSDEPDLAATMTGWAAANPNEALAMLGNLPQELAGQRDELTASVVNGLLHTDPAMASDLVLRLGSEGNARAGNLMELVAKETIRSQGTKQAAEWAVSLPDGPLKGSAMGQIADSYARKDPIAAARWAERYADQDYATNAIRQIGGNWAQNDPVAAVKWLEGLPAGGGQKAGLSNVFGDWEDSDPASAGKYLLTMPQSDKRDSAISGFAMGYAWQNPQVAIAWAQDIQNPTLRQSSLTRAGQAYFQRDPNNARLWLETSGLPAETQQQIMSGRR